MKVSTTKTISFFLLVTACLLSVQPLSAKKVKEHSLNVKSAEDMRDYFRYKGDGSILVSGHRGGHVPGFPENSLAGFANVLEQMPAFFEIDPRLTKDSVIVLMHDATLDRTTNGHGKVGDYTWAELQKLRLKDAQGNVTEHRIPTLEEAIRWSRGKTVLNLDRKDVPEAMTAALLKRLKTKNVMITIHRPDQALFYYGKNKDSMFSVFLRNKKEFEAFRKAGIPWDRVMAYVGPEMLAENREIYDFLHRQGVRCMISLSPTYDRLTEEKPRHDGYIRAIDSCPDVIESDLPVEVYNLLLPHQK